MPLPLFCRNPKANRRVGNLIAAWAFPLLVAICPPALAQSTGLPGSANADLAPYRADDLSPADTTSGGRTSANRRESDRQAADPRASTGRAVASNPTQPGEFERYVRKLPDSATVRRFGTELALGMADLNDSSDYNPAVPADYLVRSGDELVVTLWGSVNADLRLQIDRSGRITVPRIGPIMVSGVRYTDLPDVISRRVALVYKNFQVSVALGQLRGIRVYLTGFVDRPGSVVVNSLSTLMQALLRAGGPSAAGSFRDIQLRRVGTPMQRLDLYDLLLKGDRSADQLVQTDDVIHVGAIGPQVAIIGSVNRPAIFEAKRGETIDDLLRMAGGYSAVADSTRLALERLDERSTVRVIQLDQPSAAGVALVNGDVVRAFNAVDAVQSLGKQNVRIRVDGEVGKPGEYVLPPGSTLIDAVRVAGGLTAGAYLYAVEFSRESVRDTQQAGYERALRDFETQLARNVSTQRVSTSDEATAAAASNASGKSLIEQLRALRPTGRVVLNLGPDATALPGLSLENGDRLYIPSQPTTVGVFGSVFSAGSYLHSANRNVGEYLRLAGGPTRGADSASVFVVRANGSVVSSLQESGFFSRGNQIAGLVTQPGDTIFVPEELNKITWIQGAKDWTQILYQLGIGIAGIKSATR